MKKKPKWIDQRSHEIHELANRISNCDEKAKIPQLWKKLFYKVLARWGYNIKARKDLFEWQIGENMAAIDNCYFKRPKKRDFEDFKGEVAYISDRMTLCRLFRTHLIYNKLFRHGV